MLGVDDGASPEQAQAVLSRVGELRRQVVEGTDFAALARSQSEGAGASEGGDIGWIKPESLPDSLARVAATLKKGELSQPVRTNLGYHLVRAEDRKGGERLPFAAVSEKARDELYNKTLQERFAKWLKTDLRKKHRVEVKLDGYAFEAQKAERGTVGNLMATATVGEEEKGFWDYINPLTYIYDEESHSGQNGRGRRPQKGQTVRDTGVHDRSRRRSRRAPERAHRRGCGHAARCRLRHPPLATFIGTLCLTARSSCGLTLRLPGEREIRTAGIAHGHLADGL